MFTKKVIKIAVKGYEQAVMNFVQLSEQFQVR